ncbi:MAG TPA: hypothetical protein VFM59_03095 [Salinimicrobium sp.]|nr:hypothetical protein [Salinimicrobium sp.]
MKKICLTMVAAAAMIFSTQTASAQVTGEEQAPVEQQAQQQEEYVLIQATDLPAEVQQAVEKDFQGATVSEAYVNDKEGVKTFKLVVATTDGQNKELYADAKGNWIDEDNQEE